MPIRLEIGEKERQQNTVFLGRRDKEYKDRVTEDRHTFLVNVTKQLEEIQATLLQRARDFQQRHTVTINDKKELYDFFINSEGGFAKAHWSGDPAIEIKLKEDLNVTLRCIPLTDHPEPGKCIFTNNESKQQVIFAKAY